MQLLHEISGYFKLFLSDKFTFSEKEFGKTYRNNSIPCPIFITAQFALMLPAMRSAPAIASTDWITLFVPLSTQRWTNKWTSGLLTRCYCCGVQYPAATSPKEFRNLFSVSRQNSLAADQKNDKPCKDICKNRSAIYITYICCPHTCRLSKRTGEIHRHRRHELTYFAYPGAVVCTPINRLRA